MVSAGLILNPVNYMSASIIDTVVYPFVFQFNFRGIQLHRKELYTSLSLLLALILFGALVNDFVSIINVEMPENSTHEFTFTILVSMIINMQRNILPNTMPTNFNLFRVVPFPPSTTCTNRARKIAFISIGRKIVRRCN